MLFAGHVVGKMVIHWSFAQKRTKANPHARKSSRPFLKQCRLYGSIPLNDLSFDFQGPTISAAWSIYTIRQCAAGHCSDTKSVMGLNPHGLILGINSLLHFRGIKVHHGSPGPSMFHTIPKTTRDPWKWMVGRRSFPFWMAYFQGLCWF